MMDIKLEVMKKLFIYLVVLFVMVACNQNKSGQWSDCEIDEWFGQSEWSTALNMKPEISINKRLFAEQCMANSEAWAASLRFLKENNLVEMAPGKYDLTSDGVYATVSDYITKDIDTVFYEAHRKYIDIQYIASGREYIAITTLENIDSVKQVYDEVNDIEFFQKTDDRFVLADSTKFFVFFPSDPHKPCLKVDENSKVRKIVIKIPIKEID